VGLGILAILQNGLNLLEVNAFSQYIVKGFIILAAVGFDGWMRSLASSAQSRKRTVLYPPSSTSGTTEAPASAAVPIRGAAAAPSHPR
jgi:hypothetical protein